MTFSTSPAPVQDDCPGMTPDYELINTPECSPMSQQGSQKLLYTPASPPPSHQEDHFEWPTTCATSDAGYSSIQNESWSLVAPRGLGLFLPTFEIDEVVQQYREPVQTPTADAQYAPLSALRNSGLPIVQPRYLVNDQFNEGYNDISIDFSGSPWDVFPSAFPATSHALSPSCSDYSMLSCPSPVLQPFPRSASEIPNTGSPFIKIEAPQEDTLMTDNAVTKIEYSPLISPWGGDKHSPGSIEEHGLMYLAPSPGSEMIDSESPVEETERPRASSSDDIWTRKFGDRKKRKYTTVENARQTCDVCGKLFQRKFNYRKHMETHQSSRTQPFPCEYDGCGKSFARRTDLARHEKSLHLQVRDHACWICNNAWFARKDTLRRHIEDGCPQRSSVKKRERRARFSDACTV